MREHLGASGFTEKRMKGDNDNFFILASNNNDFKVTLM